MIGATQCFNIRLVEVDASQGVSPWQCLAYSASKEIRCGHNFLERNPIIIVADPFLFVHNEELYLFYEEKRLLSPGILKMIKTNDLESWTEPVTVLQEPFHLSYPFVFEHEGEVYMIPETGDASEIRLYKATDGSLTKFEKVSTLLCHDMVDSSIEIDYADSSVVKLGNLYYLMTTLKINGVNRLLLYISENLEGPYHQHPQSPICISQKFGRNAGCLLEWNDNLYRFAQDCDGSYGKNVSVFKVYSITETGYEEELVAENVFDNSLSWYKEGGHQLNFVRFKNKTVVATDSRESRFFAADVIRKIKKRL